MDSPSLRGEGLPQTVARSGKHAVLTGPFDDPSLKVRCGIGEFSLTSIQGWPIAFRGRTLGVLVTGSVFRNDFQRAEIQQLQVGGEFQFENYSKLNFGVANTEYKNRSAFTNVCLRIHSGGTLSLCVLRTSM